MNISDRWINLKLYKNHSIFKLYTLEIFETPKNIESKRVGIGFLFVVLSINTSH